MQRICNINDFVIGNVNLSMDKKIIRNKFRNILRKHFMPCYAVASTASVGVGKGGMRLLMSATLSSISMIARLDVSAQSDKTCGLQSGDEYSLSATYPLTPMCEASSFLPHFARIDCQA